MEIEENRGSEMINIDLSKNQSQQQRRRNNNHNNVSFSSTENDAALLSMSVEEIFQGQAVPSWKEQLTLRAFAVSLVLGFLMSCVVMKLNLTTGIIPSLNVSAGLLGFFMVKMWTKVAGWMGWFRQPFTRQENTVVQTCVVACSGIAFSGGFGSYILAMTKTIADQQQQQQQQHHSPVILTSAYVKELSLGWLIAFLFLVSFVGLFSIVPLRKIMIIDYKLTYPSGTATAHLINSFHTPQGAHLAKKQVSMLFKASSFSFFWSFFQWFYTGGDDCGFAAFPTFGLKAFANKFYFDFSATYVGVGMLCPYIINISLLIGAIISWGILWPFINNKSGVWYDANIDPGSLKGLSGYKVFIPISMILGDGLFNFLVVAFKTLADIYNKYKQNSPTLTPSSIYPSSSLTYDDRRRRDFFLIDQIPAHAAVAAYILLSILSLLTVPLIFHQLRPYQILIIYLLAPLLAFCNSYGCGLTDWSLASSYGKIAIFSFGAWAGMSHGGLLAGLAACGVMMSIVSTASDLMQDFKTGYLTLASPRSMFVSQVVGTAMGCVIAPCVFWIFYQSFDAVGKAGSEYPAPYAGVYRGIALIGVEGSEALPKYCWNFCVGFFVAAILLDAFKLAASHYKWRIVKYIPTPMGMAVPFFVGAFFTIDMCIGSLLLFIWEKLDKSRADAFAPAVASGMICGDGIWSLPAAVLAFFKVRPPICMTFFSRKDMVKVATLFKSRS